MSGLKSDKEGTKAVFLSNWAEKNNRDFLRFDYRGHGDSSGSFEETSISDWLDDTIKIIMELTSGPQILVGSSLGGWISLLFTRLYPQKVAGIIGIAAAPDFTSKYSTNNLTLEQRRELKNTGKLSFPSEYFEQPLSITQKLIEDGNKHLILTKKVIVIVLNVADHLTFSSFISTITNKLMQTLMNHKVIVEKHKNLLQNY